MFFLENGRLAVLKETGFNHRTQVVALLEPGASVGEGGALGDSFRSATIMAIEESLLFFLSRATLVSLAEKDPQILIRLLKRLLYTTNLRLQKSSERTGSYFVNRRSLHGISCRNFQQAYFFLAILP